DVLGAVAVLAVDPSAAEVAGGDELDGEAADEAGLDAVLAALVLAPHVAPLAVGGLDGPEEVAAVGADHAHGDVEPGAGDLAGDDLFLVLALPLGRPHEGVLRAELADGEVEPGPQDHDEECLTHGGSGSGGGGGGGWAGQMACGGGSQNGRTLRVVVSSEERRGGRERRGGESASG